jgi:hypothetical protein
MTADRIASDIKSLCTWQFALRIALEGRVSIRRRGGCSRARHRTANPQWPREPFSPDEPTAPAVTDLLDP